MKIQADKSTKHMTLPTTQPRTLPLSIRGKKNRKKKIRSQKVEIGKLIKYCVPDAVSKDIK